ncbi:hypothetical protein ACJZ2D_006402 [Fusarium nematophilum]
MADTFHLFSRLPPELRLQIWTQALRPRDPGVHFFTLDPVLDTSETDEPRFQHLARPLILSRDYRKRYSLGAPSFPLPLDVGPNPATEDKVSWTRNNPSTYLIDGGLWTASKESRRVMESEYQMQKWDAVRKGRQHTKKWGSDVYDDPGGRSYTYDKEKRIPSMGLFVNKDSTGQYFTVLPNWDLLFLQARDFDIGLISQVGRLWSFNAGYHGFKNVAINYDPTWWAEVEYKRGYQRHESGSLLANFALQASFAKEIKTFWFVDYGMKREFNGSRNRPDRKVFEGVGCRFIQVYEDDEEFESNTGFGSLSFCKTVEDAAQWKQDDVCVADDWFYNGERACYGVLACEYF